MLKYVERIDTDCEKWDELEETFGADGLLALWVADMDFAIDNHIMDAIQKYLSTGVIGYYRIPDSYYESFINWEQDEHGLTVDKDWIRFSPGVVVGFHMALQVLTNPSDAVIINTPVYYPFMNAVRNNGRKLVENELVNNNGIYTIDFDEFEKQIIDNDVKAYLMCSPHNPVGRVWTEEELNTILKICRRHNVAIILDEIHHDLVFGDNKHIPTLSLALKTDRIIMLTAASKTFNIAGLQNSFVVIENDELRTEWDEYTDGLRLKSGNPIGYIGVQAAYTHGKPWLEEVKSTIYDNYKYMVTELEKALPKITFTPLEGTYLAWVDMKAYLNEDEVKPFMVDKCKLAFDFGDWFGGNKSGTHIRVNLATRRENIEEMVNRIVSNIK